MAKIEIDVKNLDVFINLVSLLKEYHDDLPEELQKSLKDMADDNKRERFKNLTTKEFFNIVRQS